MRQLSCLTDPTTLLIADASVAINLIATGYAIPILDALPHRLGISEIAAGEVEDGRLNGYPSAETLGTLVQGGKLSLLNMGSVAEQHFERLVIGSTTDTLDDGEAATIACAVERKATPLIDERKATRICATRFPELRVASTGDILSHPAVAAALGDDFLAEAIFNALRTAKMRISPRLQGWAVELIGRERAAQCSSLPRVVREPSEGLVEA